MYTNIEYIIYLNIKYYLNKNSNVNYINYHFYQKFYFFLYKMLIFFNINNLLFLIIKT